MSGNQFLILFEGFGFSFVAHAIDAWASVPHLLAPVEVCHLTRQQVAISTTWVARPCNRSTLIARGSLSHQPLAFSKFITTVRMACFSNLSFKASPEQCTQLLLTQSTKTFSEGLAGSGPSHRESYLLRLGMILSGSSRKKVRDAETDVDHLQHLRLRPSYSEAGGICWLYTSYDTVFQPDDPDENLSYLGTSIPPSSCCASFAGTKRLIVFSLHLLQLAAPVNMVQVLETATTPFRTIREMRNKETDFELVSTISISGDFPHIYGLRSKCSLAIK